MASQLVGVSGNRRLTPSEIAKLRARQAYLPQILQAEQARKQMRKESQFRKAQLTQEKKQAKAGLQFQREESAKGMGLEAAKLGTTIMSADFGTNMGTPKLASQMRPTAGEIGAGAKPPATQGIYSNMGNLNVGGGIQGAVGGAGLGFGLGQMFGKKKLGLLTGGLGALIGSGIGSGFFSTLFSGLAGKK